MKISIIIPTYNKENRFKLMLKSLLCQDAFFENCEVIIIDDGSTQAYHSIKEICENYSNIRYYKTSNKGRAHARNIGISKAKYDCLLFLDDDVIVSPNLLNEYIKSQEKEQSIIHGKIVDFVYSYPFDDPVTGLLYDEEKKRLINSHDLLNFMNNQCLTLLNGYNSVFSKCKVGLLEQKIINVFNLKDKKNMWLGFTGGNVSCPKKWIENVGGFDETYGLNWGCEDLDLGYRLFLSGYPFKYLEFACVCHIDHRRIDAYEEHRKTSKYFELKYNVKVFDEINKILFLRGSQ